MASQPTAEAITPAASPEDAPLLTAYRPRYGDQWRSDPLLRFSQRALVRLGFDTVFVGAHDGHDIVALSHGRLDPEGDVVGSTASPDALVLRACELAMGSERLERAEDDGTVAVAVPILDPSGLAIGVFAGVDTSGREWGQEDQDFLEALALACSGEIRMRRLEQAARLSVERAETSRARTRVLLQLSEGFAAARTVRDVARTVMQLATHALHASYGNIRLLDGHELRHIDLGEFPGYPTPIFPRIAREERTPSRRAVETLLPSFYEDFERFEADYPHLASRVPSGQMQAFAHLPLMVGQRTLGAIAISWPTARTFDADERAVIGALARYTAQAVDRALLLAQQRDVAQTLQDAMLSELPANGDLVMAARYRPAVESERVGGDWYDAFEGPEGSTTLVVGDVSGHDIRAAAIMGQLRSMLRALGTDAPDTPAGLLARLERTMQRLGFEQLTTALVVNVNRASDGTASVTVANAGHLPPLLVEPGRPPRFLDGHDRLLGLERLSDRHDHQYTVGADSTVLLYTDGLVERRTSDLDDTLDELAAAADRHRDLPVDELVDALLAGLGGERDDDTVILAARLETRKL